MMLYDADEFGGRSRDEFLGAVRAEGVPVGAGYGTPLSDSPALQHLAAKYPGLIRRLPCPNAEQVVTQSARVTDSVLLGSREDMDDIVEAIAKVRSAFRRTGAA